MNTINHFTASKNRLKALGYTQRAHSRCCCQHDLEVTDFLRFYGVFRGSPLPGIWDCSSPGKKGEEEKKTLGGMENKLYV